MKYEFGLIYYFLRSSTTRGYTNDSMCVATPGVIASKFSYYQKYAKTDDRTRGFGFKFIIK